MNYSLYALTAGSLQKSQRLPLHERRIRLDLMKFSSTPVSPLRNNHAVKILLSHKACSKPGASGRAWAKLKFVHLDGALYVTVRTAVMFALGRDDTSA